MSVLRKRGQKMMRKKFGKKVTLTQLKKLWDDWVEYAIIRPLLADGKVYIDKHTYLEIVGYKPEKNASIINLLSKGMAVTKSGRIIEPKLIGRNRKDFLYKIVCVDTLYKNGVVIFKADRELSKRVADALENTQNYYRIAI